MRTSFFVALFLILPFRSYSEPAEFSELELLYSCGDVKISSYLESNFTVFDSYQGIESFIQNRLPHWFMEAVRSASEDVVKDFLMQDINSSKLEAAYVSFYHKLRLRLRDKAAENSKIVGDCEMAMQDLIEVLGKNKYYNLYNGEFRKMFIQFAIPLDLRNTKNFLKLWLFISMTRQGSGKGVCIAYEQQGASKKSSFNFCN